MFYLSIGREFGFAILSFANMQTVPFAARGAVRAVRSSAVRRCGFREAERAVPCGHRGPEKRGAATVCGGSGAESVATEI